MTIQLQSVLELTAVNGVKVLVYGNTGTGKTRLCATAPTPLILSAESGLLALRKVIKETGVDIHVIVIRCIQDLYDAYNQCLTQEYRGYYKTICLDSISEIAEAVLAAELPNHKDPRKAYGEMQTTMTNVIRMFRDLEGYNVYFSAKQAMVVDESTGGSVLGVSMPGRQLGPAIPYFFDEVFYSYTGRTPEGQPFFAMQTTGDNRVTAKDRSGMLDLAEQPDLTNIFNKILQG